MHELQHYSYDLAIITWFRHIITVIYLYLGLVNNFILHVFVRPPSCMAAIRSYPTHLVKFREKFYFQTGLLFIKVCTTVNSRALCLGQARWIQGFGVIQDILWSRTYIGHPSCLYGDLDLVPMGLLVNSFLIIIITWHMTYHGLCLSRKLVDSYCGCTKNLVLPIDGY